MLDGGIVAAAAVDMRDGWVRVYQGITLLPIDCSTLLYTQYMAVALLTADELQLKANGVRCFTD